MRKVHFKWKGARRTACGRLIKGTKHDTTLHSKVTCTKCRNTNAFKL